MQGNYIPYPLSNIIPNVRENEDYLYNGKGFTKNTFSASRHDVHTHRYRNPYSRLFKILQPSSGMMAGVLALQLVNLERTTNHYWIDPQNSIATAANPTKSPRVWMNQVGFSMWIEVVFCGRMVCIISQKMEWKTSSQSSGWGAEF